MQNISIQENKRGWGRALWVFTSPTASEIFSFCKDIHIQIFSAIAIAVTSLLSSPRSWALKTNGHLVIVLSGGRLDLQIGHPMTTLRLIIKSTEVPKVKEEVSIGLACPTLAVHLSVTTVSPQKSWH